MKAISLWQPWATLIALGQKQFETRSWSAPLSVMGQRIAVHAAKAGLGKAEEKTLLERPEFKAALSDPEEGLPRGAVVATAVLVRCTLITPERADHLREWSTREYAFGDYTPGRFAWVFADVQVVEPPIPAKGRQGFFDVELDPTLFEAHA